MKDLPLEAVAVGYSFLLVPSSAISFGVGRVLPRRSLVRRKWTGPLSRRLLSLVSNRRVRRSSCHVHVPAFAKPWHCKTRKRSEPRSRKDRHNLRKRTGSATYLGAVDSGAACGQLCLESTSAVLPGKCLCRKDHIRSRERAQLNGSDCVAERYCQA